MMKKAKFLDARRDNKKHDKNSHISECAAAKLLQSCLTLRAHRQQPTRLLCPWDSPGKNTGVGCHFLLLSVCYYMLNTILSLKFNLHNNSMQ